MNIAKRVFIAVSSLMVLFVAVMMASEFEMWGSRVCMFMMVAVFYGRALWEVCGIAWPENEEQT